MATLEELDAFGNMDSLDSFGTLEQLDNLTLHSASAAVSMAVTTSAAVNRILSVASAVDISISLSASTSTTEYTVTVVAVGGANKYFINGIQQPTLELFEGNTYVFNYPSAHPFRFSTTSDGTHNSGSEYTTGVTHNSSTQVTIVVAASAPTLYYYCSIHSGMGGQANTPINESSGSGLIQTVASGVSIALTESSAATRIQTAGGNPTISIDTTLFGLGFVGDLSGIAAITLTESSSANLILSMQGDSTIALTGTVAGELLGEAWTVIIPDSPTWSTLQ